MKEQNEMPISCHRFLWLVLILASIAGSCALLYHATHTTTYTIDSYFYLSKAKQLAGGEGLATSWNDGLDTKYFPGYSVFLAFSFLLGGSHVPVQIISYILCLLLLSGIMRELEFGPPAQLLAGTAFVANPIVIKWFALPMAEGVALTLSLLSVWLFIRFIRLKSYPLLFAACMVGGVAAITRAESLFLFVVFGALTFPARRNLSWPRLLAGTVLFFLPLLVYWIRLRTLGAEGPAYLKEFGRTFLHFDLLKNLAYNVWVPFGLMHRLPVLSESSRPVFIATVTAGAIWLLLGECVFIGGLACSLLGRLGPRLRSISLLFLAYALLHSLWYYRYERFMLMAVPLAAIVWAASARAILLSSGENKKARWRLLLLTQLLIAAAGIYFGNQYSLRHAVALREDTSGLRFQHIAGIVNTLNRDTRSAVLTDLGPHLAYYLDAHAYLDTAHRDYWRRAFPPERTLEEMNELGIGYVVTGETPDRWFERHQIPPGARPMFKTVESQAEGASIIEYSP